MDEQKVPSQTQVEAKPVLGGPSSTPQSPLISPGELIFQSWEVYKKIWKRLLFLILLNYAAFIPLGVLALVFVVIGAFNPKGFFSLSMIVSIFVAVIIAFFYVSIVSSLLSITTVLSIKRRTETVGIKLLLKEAWGKLWAYWYVSFLVGFLVMGGILLFIVPGIIFSVWFSFALYVFLFEGKKGMDALVTSREYIRGRWIEILGRGLLIGILMILVTYVPLLLFSLVKLKSVGAILQAVISFAAAPYPTIATVLLYESTRKGRDLSKLASGKEKVTYAVVAALGVIVSIGLFAFIAYMAISAFTTMPKNRPSTPSQFANPYRDQLKNYPSTT